MKIPWKRILILFLFSYLSIIGSPALTQAAEMNQLASEPYTLQAGGEIIYDYQHQKIMANGGVSFFNGSLLIKAEEIIVYQETATIEASKGVSLIDKDQELQGEYLQYNYLDNNGFIQDASSRIKNISFHGEQIKITPKAADYELEIIDASLTKCRAEELHYQIKAGSIKVYPRDRIVVRSAEFWWGKVKLLTWPVYVIKYDNTGQDFTSSIPLPHIGYNTQDGLTLDYYHPYEFANGLEGDITLYISQQGDQEARISSSYPLNSRLNLLSQVNYQKEIDDQGKIEEEKNIKTGIHYNRGRVDYYTELEYDFLKDQKIINNRLKFKTAKSNLLTAVNYNIDTRDREEQFDLNYKFNNIYSLKISYDLLNEKMDKNLYQLNYTGSFVNWQLIQREGYDTDYLPYLKLKTKSFAVKRLKLTTDLGIGKIRDKGVSSQKIRTHLRMDRDFRVTPNLNMGFKGEIIDHQYFTPERDFYRVYDLTLSKAYQQQILPKLKLKSLLVYNYIFEEGNYLLSVDQADETGEFLRAEIGLSLSLPEPQSYLDLKLKGEYQLDSESWVDNSISLIRRYDCYKYSLDYQPLEKSIGFSIDFDL